MSRRSILLDVIQSAHDAELAFSATLRPAERAIAGTLDRPAPKDLLAHNTAWNERLALRIQGESSAFVTEEDVENAAIFAAHQDESLDAILAYARRVHAQLLAAMQTLSEQDLNDPELFTWTDERPLWRQIAGTACLHPLAHLGDYYSRRGESERALAMYETAAEKLAPLDDDPTWRGLLAYNLACLYALSGSRESALAGLAEALRLNPELTLWSQQDPDFTSLHDEPAYQALYA